MNRAIKSIWMNTIAVKTRNAQILAALADRPASAPMLSRLLGYEIGTTVMWELERKKLVTSYWDEMDEATVLDRNGFRRRLYTVNHWRNDR